MSNGRPGERPTVKLEEVPSWAVELTVSVKKGFAELGADIAMVSNDLGVVKDRVAILESYRNDQEARATRTSLRVEHSSKIDLEHDAQLAQERAAREELASKVDTLLAIGNRLEKITSNPTIKVILGMVATAIVTWLASHGGAVIGP